MPTSEDKPLTLSELPRDGSIVALGAVAAKELLIRKEVAFFVDSDGNIQLIPIPELLLDSVPETMAIQEMIKQGIEDRGIELYLRGRDTRIRLRNGGVL